jgi:hypothetical protein
MPSMYNFFGRCATASSVAQASSLLFFRSRLEVCATLPEQTGSLRYFFNP